MSAGCLSECLEVNCNLQGLVSELSIRKERGREREREETSDAGRFRREWGALGMCAREAECARAVT